MKIWYSLRRPFITSRTRARVEWELAQCPDDASKLKLLDEMMRVGREQELRIEQHYNAVKKQYGALRDMMNAVYAYTYFPRKDISAEQYNDAPELFGRARDQMLMNTKWMMRSDPDNDFLEKLIDLLEPAQIDSFSTYGDWNIFFKVIQSIISDESNNFLNRCSPISF